VNYHLKLVKEKSKIPKLQPEAVNCMIDTTMANRDKTSGQQNSTQKTPLIAGYGPMYFSGVSSS
jgi:hypothetical protein